MRGGTGGGLSEKRSRRCKGDSAAEGVLWRKKRSRGRKHMNKKIDRYIFFREPHDSINLVNQINN